MKKKIVSLVGALVLTCALGLNVFAADSPEAVKDVAQGVEGVPATEEELKGSAEKAKQLIDFSYNTDLSVSQLATENMMPIARKLAELKGKSDVEKVKVVAAFELTGTPGSVVIDMSLNANESVYALHVTKDGNGKEYVEEIPGVKFDTDKVIFKFSSFSPVAIVRVENKVNPASQNSNNTPAATAAPVATAMINGVLVPMAPKTSDTAMMVAAMAVLFMAGAVVAVSRKRA